MYLKINKLGLGKCRIEFFAKLFIITILISSKTVWKKERTSPTFTIRV